MEIFKTTIGELFDFYLEHEEETFVCGTVLHMFDPLSRIGFYDVNNFTIDVIDVFLKHFPSYVRKPWFAYYSGATFEYYISEDYYTGSDSSVRNVRISLMADIITTYGRDVELEFEIVKRVE